MQLLQVSAVFSALHLLALAIGLPSIFVRARTLAGPLDGAGLGRLFTADSVWGLAALLWVGTGLMRAFGGLEKGSQFYLASPLFGLKMALLGAILVLELWPMLTFIRWRIVRGRGGTPETSAARGLFVISVIQVVLVVLMVFVASFMARGFNFT